MATRFAFIYFLKDRPAKIREVAPYHADYWRDGGVERCEGGPFVDRDGGLILFDASCLSEAEAVVAQDPFAVHSLLARWWLKEWLGPET